ncbi:MAG: ATP-binding cassette domain-containing protein [Planctomycetota bacterium]|nr:ATP-binding cassette domain-containing protein [Planctomycetota bacterium]
MIEVKGLSKHFNVPIKVSGLSATIKHFFNRQYRRVDAVKALDFSIKEGEFVGFLGANGAGKTTTLKMLTGLIHPSGGSVNINGHTPFDRKKEFLQDITLVMGQKQQLIWDLPAMDSLRINAAVYEISKGDFDERIEELASMLELKDKLTSPVRKLSLGERMKAEFMAALLHRPRLLFLDEPTLGLDINAQSAVRRFLKDYNTRHNATVILTSHYMADITTLCERVLIIHEGGLVHDGVLSELIENFAPFRQVKVELGSDVDKETLSKYGEVESLNGAEARLTVRRDELTEVVSKLLSEQNVLDLTVTDPPIEEIIGRVFQKGSVS